MEGRMISVLRLNGLLTSFIILLCMESLGHCIQANGMRCNEEVACELAARAEALLKENPAALTKSTLLLADAAWHKPSLQTDISLRTSLELTRKSIHVVPHNKGVRTLARSN